MAYCTVTLSGLSMDCNTNVGGIRTAYIANYADGIFSSASGAVTGVSSATTWYQYNFKKDTGNFTSTLNVDAANGVNYVSTEINLVFARMETAKRVEMAALALGELAVVIKDSNNKYWAFGVEESVVANAGAAETGTARGDANQYTITLLDTASSFPMELTEDAVTALLSKVNA